VKELSYAGFVPRVLDDALEKRAGCADEPVRAHMLTERVEVGGDFSDVQVAETFLHHRVLIVPVVEDGRVLGVITRSELFRQLAERFWRSSAGLVDSQRAS
jgi:CBS domain-containing protein